MRDWDSIQAGERMRDGTDPEWIALKAESEKDGAFVKLHESTFLKLTDFSQKV